MIFLGGKSRNHFWKRRKSWLPAFSPFHTMFSKGFFLKVVKSRDYVGKGQVRESKKEKTQNSTYGGEKYFQDTKYGELSIKSYVMGTR